MVVSMGHTICFKGPDTNAKMPVSDTDPHTTKAITYLLTCCCGNRYVEKLNDMKNAEHCNLVSCNDRISHDAACVSHV